MISDCCTASFSRRCSFGAQFGLSGHEVIGMVKFYLENCFCTTEGMSL